MVVVRISMGLGNQLFQYAAGLALSLEKSTKLKVDISSYNGYKLRKYELETFFEINTAHANKVEVASYRYNHPVKRIWNKFFPKNNIRTLGLPYEEKFVQQKLLAIHDFFYPPYKRKTYIEPYYHYDENFFKASGDIYLQGYWMSWKYFEKYDAQIKNAFAVKTSLVKHLGKIVMEMNNANSASIHIRRTDYTKPEVVKLKGIIQASFYHNAIEYIKNKTGTVILYIFSDDISWVKENLNIPGTVVNYVDDTISKSAIEDFYLMTQCKHNIIANSTFSWWAAYLNTNENKQVIAPKKWYAQPYFDSKDVYPVSWVVMDS